MCHSISRDYIYSFVFRKKFEYLFVLEFEPLFRKLTESLRNALDLKEMTFNDAKFYYEESNFDERMFLDQLLASFAGNCSYVERNFSQIIANQPLVPGLVYPNSSLFYSNLIKDSLKKYVRLIIPWLTVPFLLPAKRHL